MNVRLHPGHPASGGGEPARGQGEGPAGGRLNLLLSQAGWRGEWAEQLPALLEPMGVKSHRAGSGREASAVISAVPIHLAVVDLALPFDTTPKPEPAGCRLLDLLRRLDHRPPTVAVRSSTTQREATRDLQTALRMGAFAVIDRPNTSRDLELLLEILRRALDRYYRGCWPAIVGGAGGGAGGPTPPTPERSPHHPRTPHDTRM